MKQCLAWGLAPIYLSFNYTLLNVTVKKDFLSCVPSLVVFAEAQIGFWQKAFLVSLGSKYLLVDVISKIPVGRCHIKNDAGFN